MVAARCATGCLWANARVWRSGGGFDMLLACNCSMLTINVDAQSFASPLSGWGIARCVQVWARGTSGTGDILLEVERCMRVCVCVW